MNTVISYALIVSLMIALGLVTSAMGFAHEAPDVHCHALDHAQGKC